MELARSFQRLVVIFLVVSPPIGALDRVHLVVMVARALAPEIITVVTAPVPTFSMVAAVSAVMVPIVKTSTTVVSSKRLVGASRIFSDEVFCHSDELGHRGQPFAQ